MKKFIAIIITAIIMLFIPGCYESSDDVFVGYLIESSYNKDLMRSRIEAWRLIEIKDDYNSSSYFNDYTARHQASYRNINFRYDREKQASEDRRLQTYLETEHLRSGICGDLAVWLYMRLRDLGFGDGQLAVIVFFPNTGPGHIEACKLEDPSDINSFRIIRSYEISPVGECPDGMRAVMGFNLFDTWEYD